MATATAPKPTLEKIVIRVTVNQVPNTKKWLSEVDSKYSVVTRISDSGRISIKGQTKAICEEAKKAIKDRVMQEDFQNAMEILTLKRSHCHHEQFDIDKNLLGHLDDSRSVELLKNYESLLKCVVKIDRTGHISIFGDQPHHCEGIKDLIIRMVSGTELKNEAKDETDSEADKTLEANVVGAGIATAASGELARKLEDEIGSAGSQKSTSPAAVKSNNSAASAETNKLMGKGNIPAKQELVNSTRTFSQQPMRQQKPMGDQWPFKDRVAIDEDLIKHVIGRQSANRARLEKEYDCRIHIDHDPSLAISMVKIEARTEAGKQEAKKDVMNMIQKLGSRYCQPKPVPMPSQNMQSGTSGGLSDGRSGDGADSKSMMPKNEGNSTATAVDSGGMRE